MIALPTPQSIKNIAGHIATAAGTAIAIFGLQAKGIDPAKVTAAIIALGDVANNIIIGIGVIGSAYAAYKAAQGSSTPAVVSQSSQAISANPQAVAASLPPETTIELAKATIDMAANSEAAKHTLLDNIVTLPSVQGVIVDKQTAMATSSPLVTATPSDIPAA